MEAVYNILVVDDDPAIVELVGETLAGVGMHIVPCINANKPQLIWLCSMS